MTTRMISSNRIERHELKPGDHIYVWRKARTYAHHGIFVGDGRVIHFIPVSTSKVSQPCKICGFRKDMGGVVKTCIDCFLDGGHSFLHGHHQYRFEYLVSPVLYIICKRGTCTRAQADEPDVVIRRAEKALEKGFGTYDLLERNCEDFAIYCKTKFNGKPSRQSVAVSATVRAVLAGAAAFSSLFGLAFASLYYMSDVPNDSNPKKEEEKENESTLHIKQR